MKDTESDESGDTIISPEVNHINTCYGRFVALGEHNRKSLVDQINEARNIGMLLIAEKSKCRRGEWQGKFRSAKGKGKTRFTFYFDYNTGRNFVKVANALPHPITDLPEGVRVMTDIYRGMGVLPDPEEQEWRRPRLEFLDRASKQVGVALEVIGKWREKTPVEQWTDRQREALKDQLQPLVELYRELEGDGEPGVA